MAPLVRLDRSQQVEVDDRLAGFRTVDHKLRSADEEGVAIGREAEQMAPLRDIDLGHLLAGTPVEKTQSCGMVPTGEGTVAVAFPESLFPFDKNAFVVGTDQRPPRRSRATDARCASATPREA